MAEDKPLPEIPEFTVWEDEFGLHANWLRELDDIERAAGVAEGADAPPGRPDSLAVVCAEMRIRRDLVNRPLHRAWRSCGSIARTALDDIDLTTGDLPS